MAHYGVKNDFKMLTYYLYALLFQSFLPCTALIYPLFQQALKRHQHVLTIPKKYLSKLNFVSNFFRVTFLTP
jgi:hypothetical protein